MTRRGLQVALGALWLLDGALQLQPFMLRASFGRQVLAAAALGQPHLVSGPVHWSAHVVAAHPVVWDLPFATTQLLLGAGMLLRRTSRLALAASVAWALGVWFFGEGLSGLAGGEASLLSGAPGAVLLYAMLALAAWPDRGRVDVPPPRRLLFAWTTLWTGAAILQALPKNDRGADVADAVRANGSPRALADFESSLAGWIGGHGTSAVTVLVVVEAAIGLAVLARRTRRPALVAGIVLSAALWVVCQDFGDLYTGHATDPNTAPLIALMAVALLGRRTPIERSSDQQVDSRRFQMTRNILRKRRIAVLLAAFGVVGAIAALTTAPASAQGRTIEGSFCLGQHLFCMSAGLNGQAPVEGFGIDGNGGVCAKPPGDPTIPSGPQYCIPSNTGLLTLRPGTYWIAVNDDQSMHNFSFRSCPGSSSPCSESNPDAVSEQAITAIPTVYTAPVTTKVDLKPGWYRLFCDADMPVVHETAGMYVDIEVGGAG